MQTKAAFIHVIQENNGLIRKVTRMFAFGREDEQDLYQEIIYQLWKSSDSFRNESKRSTWMYRIALNTSIAHLNREKKKVRFLPIDDYLLNTPEPDDALMEERYDLMYNHIRELNLVDRGIILLYLEGKSYEEMAAVTGFTTTNIGTRLARIKQKLAENIKNK